MKKLICMLLSCVMLLAVCAPMALAIKEAPPKMDGPEIVIFSTDFEKDAVGAKPSGFTSSIITDIACMFVAEEGGNKFVKAYHGDAKNPEESFRAPRVEKSFGVSGLYAFDISMDVKTSGGQSYLQFVVFEEESRQKLYSVNATRKVTEWSHVRFAFDLQAMTVTMYMNDKLISETDLPEFTEKKFTLQVQCAAYPEDHSAMFDNLKISTTQVGYDPNPGIIVEDLTTPYNAADEKEETGNIVALISENFEEQKANALYAVRTTGIGFSKNAVNAAAPLVVKEEDGNKFVRGEHADPNVPDAIKKSPRLGRPLSLPGAKAIVVDMDVRGSVAGDSTMNLRVMDTSANKVLSQIAMPTAFKKWTHVKVRYDIEACTAKIYTGGKLYKEVKADFAGVGDYEMQVYAVLAPDGSYWEMDNFKLTTENVDLGGVIRLDGSVAINNVKLDPSEKTGMIEAMNMSHPRLFTTDWNAVNAKVETDPSFIILKKNIINFANNRAKLVPTAYYRNERNTINDCSTASKINMVTLAAAYCLTKDAYYKDTLWKELEAVGNWPDWGADAYLCTAHILLGFAVSYDWLYHDWTEAERVKIEQWMLNMGMAEAVIGYEGRPKGTNWVNRVSNWTPVCNGSNMIAALAIADKYPDLADYILRKGNEGLQPSFTELTPDGGYAETIGYWDYGIRHQVKLMAALESCLKPGASLPADLDYTNVSGLNNTGDFQVYANGAAGAFNYGDGVTDYNNTPILYWLSTKYDKPQYAWYNMNMIQNHPDVNYPQNRDAVWMLLWYDPAHTATADPAFSLDKFFQSTVPDGNNSLSMRASWTDLDAMVVMAHAGDARTGHMHHDAGGFVLDWQGKRWVHMYGRRPGGTNEGIVYGWPGYHNHVETGGHYDYYHARGEANNTIIANPQQNKPDMNLNYYAPLVRSESGANTAFGIFDMTDTNVDYVSAKRGFMLTDMRETLVIQDEIVASKPSEFYWFANTLAEITLSADGKSAVLDMDGDTMLVRITQGPASAKLGVMDTKPLPTSPNPSVQTKINEKKLFIHIENEQTLNLTVEFTPLKEGEGTPAPQAIVPLDSWSTAGSPALTTSQSLGDIVALKVDNPNAYAKGAKTYVDTANLGIMPLVQNGRTLVPVRFIAEKFGAKVGWDDATQTVSVDTETKKIRLQIGSNQMFVNDAVTVLDVPAQTIGGRTLIPLRALVESLGKQVFWDDRGLIIISDKVVNYDADTITKLIDLLDIRVQIDGAELKFFDSEVYNYNVAATYGAVPYVTASATAGASVTQGNPAVVSVGSKNYNIYFGESVLDVIFGGPDAIRRIAVVPDNGPKPSGQKHISIQGATSSVEFTMDKYPMNGTYDGVINDTITLNRWSANGAGNWVAYDLGEVKTIHSVAIAGFLSSQRSYTFEIAVSNDGANWTVVNPGAVTTNGSDRDVFKLGDIQARYIRLTGLAATNTTWMGISEVRFYADAASEAADQASWSSEFYDGMLHGLIGDTRKVLISGVNGKNEAVAVNMADVQITSADPSVATVDALGNVKLVGTGKTQILVEAIVGGMPRSYSIEVRVQ